MDFDFQKYAFQKIREHNKVALLWFRQTGKSKTVIDSVIDYIQINPNKTIIIYSVSKGSSKHLRKRFANKLNIDFKYTIDTININDCLIKFRGYQRLLNGEEGDFIVIDDFNCMTNRSFNILKDYITRADKILLTCQGVHVNLLTLDADGQYYLNVVSMDIIRKSEREEIKKRSGYNDFLFDLMYDVGNPDAVYSFYNIKKNRGLIDCYSILRQRKQKLEQLNSSFLL